MKLARLSSWTLLLLLASAPHGALAQAEDAESGYSEEERPSRGAGRWSQRESAPPAGRWSVAEVTDRPERGAYSRRPAARPATRPYEDDDAPSYRRPMRASRVETALGASSKLKKGDPTVKRVWTDEDGARVKTIYGDDGQVVYRKAWSKKTGEEVPAGRKEDAPSALEAPRHRAQARAPQRRIRQAESDEHAGGRASPEDRFNASGHDGPHHIVHRKETVRDGPTGFSISIPAWYNRLTGTLAGPTGTGTGTIAEDNNTKPGLEFAMPRWFLGYQPIRHNTTVANAFTFRGTTYAAGANLRFDADIIEGYFRTGLYGKHVFQLDWMVGVKGILPTFRVTSPGLTSSYTTEIPVPYIGLIGNFEINRDMLLKGFVKYSSLTVGSAQETMTEAEGALAYEWKSDYEFGKMTQLKLGYRLLQLDVITNNTGANRGRADVDLAGPFAAITSYF